MKSSLLIATLFIVLSWAGYAQANPSLNCPERLVRVGQTQVHQIESYTKDNCFISISNRANFQNLIYRSYLVTRDSLLIFLSLGEGPEEFTTGSKEFYFFPRNVKNQGISWPTHQKTINVEARYDFDYIFDAQNSELVAMTNATVTVDPKISPDNEAGITIQPKRGLIYELPFVLNGTPSSDPQITGVFKDAFGQACRVKVSQIFKKDSNDERVIKYTDHQLKNILKKICPQIRY